MLRSIRSVLKCKKGVAALEYSILAGMIVIGVVAAINTSGLKENINTVFTNIGTALTNASKTSTTTPPKE